MKRLRQSWCSLRAEFFKICAFRFPLYASIGLLLYVALITYELIASEDLAAHAQAKSALTLMPYLAWASWGKLIVIQVFLIAFATYCTVVDSQYGMVRIGCSQPLSRFEFMASKTLAILAHAALFILLYILLLVLSSAIAGGHWTMAWKEVAPVLAFSARLIVLSLGITCVVIAAALFRRTLLTGFITAILVIIGFAWLNVLPMRYGLRPYLLLRYFIYPLFPILPGDWNGLDFPNADASTWQFLVACLAVPAVCWSASVAYFSRRDITE